MTLQVGLVGCGRWGKHILRDLQALGCEVAVADHNEQARSHALTVGATQVVSHLDHLPDAQDGYVVATPTATHVEVVLQLLGRDRPIFCEKPLSNDVAQARAIAERAPNQVFLMDKWRYHPGVDALRQVAQSGQLGAIQQVQTRRVQWGNPHRDVDGVWVLAPHDLAIVQHILGEIPPPRAAVGHGTPDQMDGVVALLGDRPAAIIEVSTRQPVNSRLISVAGADAVAVLDDPLASAIQVFQNGCAEPDYISISTEFPLLRELRVFCEFLQGGAPPLTNAVEATRMVEAIASIRQLAQPLRAEPPSLSR
ncbi:MAG: Gfo/Idh/MocA family oxidoreductase [Kaiparowitsia implicata GSE-PSE-MK54-09C]|jgi:predicted dehydrogenase|nr:Gfo/Idh/MocA family oxidoreductase [Kaiparowitsia implicata GSE-PSE-MK54-09C]